MPGTMKPKSPSSSGPSPDPETPQERLVRLEALVKKRTLLEKVGREGLSHQPRSKPKTSIESKVRLAGPRPASPDATKIRKVSSPVEVEETPEVELDAIAARPPRGRAVEIELPDDPPIDVEGDVTEIREANKISNPRFNELINLITTGSLEGSEVPEDILPELEERTDIQTLLGSTGVLGVNKTGLPLIKVNLDGDQTAHRIEDMKKIAPGRPVEEYIQEVLDKPAESFPASVRTEEKSIEAMAKTARVPMMLFLERLEEEGLHVEIRETIRPQERQEWVFQKGRSRPGRISTWTLTSDHREGRAVDVFINKDRSGKDPGYAKAWKIAEEMGLQAIGPTDAGHFSVPEAMGKKGDSVVTKDEFAEAKEVLQRIPDNLKEAALRTVGFSDVEIGQILGER